MGSRVNVFVRLRPLLKREDNEELPDCCARKLSDQKLQLWNHRNPHNDTIEYEFDNVYDSNATQTKIYESVKGVLPNVLNGQNATIFGYGPTGAGKTHTIVGTKDQPGLIPRCINYLFKLVKFNETKSQKKEAYSVHFSMLEIYQEKVFDLIVPKGKDLPVRQDSHGNIFIPELAEADEFLIKGINLEKEADEFVIKLEVTNFNDFITKYQSASNNRTIGSTNLNTHSSRSHTILLVKVVKTIADRKSEKFVGKLYLIDLAGSEDNRKTGNTGIRLKESGAINSSLFSLSMVVDALNKNLQRIPYRDSKLTRLLQDSLGGTAHSIMIACIAPEPSFYWDTLNTLKFASKSRQVVNKPFTKVVHERSLKRSRENDEEPTKSKRHAAAKITNVEGINEKNKENQNDIVEHVKQLLGPIGKRQEKLENNFENRLKILENALIRNQTMSKENCPSFSSKSKNIPVGKVRPLMKQSQAPLCQTPSKVAVIDTSRHDDDSDRIQASLMKKEAAISLPNLVENGGRTPKYAIKFDPQVHKDYDNKILDILNNGTIKDVMELPTIGKKRAEKIIEIRIKNGKFSSLSDLMKVGYTKRSLNSFKQKYLLKRLVIS